MKLGVRTISLISTATIALLTACGGVSLNGNNSDAPGYILTLKVSGAETQQQLEAKYGGTALAFDASAGFAMLHVTQKPASNDPMVKNVQENRAVTSPELSLSAKPVDSNPMPQGTNSNIEGWNSWSGGWNSWSGGWSSWSGGWSVWSGGAGSSAPDLPDQNMTAWNQIKLYEAHRISRKFGQGIKVAVIDTGLDTAHPMFIGRLAPAAEWKDFVDGDNNPQEANSGSGRGHGTGVAGIILQVAPKATILPIRVLAGNGGGLTANVVAGINHAVNMGAQIINLSVGTDGFDQSLLDICSYANLRGVLIIASAGNNGQFNNMTSPGLFTWYAGTFTLTLGIGSVNASDTRSSFSAYGNNLWAYAPGEQIWSASPGNQAAHYTGTSFAAPIVAGAYALGYSEVPNPANRLSLEGPFWAGFDWPMSSKYQGTDGYWKGARINLENFIRRLPGWTEPTNVQPGTYSLINVGSGKCVDVDGGSTVDGANIQQWACHNGNNQRFKIEPVGSNFKLTAVHSGRVMDVQGGGIQDPANVQQWSYGNGLNQQWTLRYISSGVYELVAVHSGKCLAVASGSVSDGGNIIQWTCNSSQSQRFRLRAWY